MEHVVFGHKRFLKSSPDRARRMVRALLQSVDFLKKNPEWAIAKIKSESGYSEEGARLSYKDLKYSQDGKVDRKTVENLRNFMMENGLTSREKTPPVSELYTGEFTS